MAEIPVQPSTVAAIYAAIEAAENRHPRSHLGASQIGRACERETWLAFRWADAPAYEGRMLRLFERGKREEAVIVEDLRRIGVEVLDLDPETGKQWQYSEHGGHMGGSMDAAACGFPEAPKTWHVCEFKTHNEKSFEGLLKNGVQESKPEHYAQMQLYMGWSGMDRAMYVAICKNDDRIHCERIAFKREVFDGLVAKARRLIFSETQPPRIADSPTFWLCKFCNFTDVCHGLKFPRVNCRTCARVTARPDGTWYCGKHEKALTPDEQKTGCDFHLYHPAQVEPILGPALDGSEDAILYEHPKGGRIVNVGGTPHFTDIATAFTSRELAQLTDDQIEAVVQVKQNFGGTVRT